ncbi:putative pol-like 32, partial [Homarus americanus]
FRTMAVSEKARTVQRLRYCFLCLRKGHQANACPTGYSPCDIDGCSDLHSRWLHPSLNHERREQLQHQRRGDNDRIAPPTCHLKITQWNVQDPSNKRHTVQAAAIAKNIDVFILQETLMSKDKQFRLAGYQQYSVPKGPNSHGSMILVRATIPISQWEVDDELTSEHFATTTLRMELLPPPPPEDIDQLSQDVTDAIRHTAEEAIPKANPTNRHHKDYWFYNDEVREQNHRINTFRRHLRQYPSPEGVKLLRAAVQHAQNWEDIWLEWCATFNAHTSLSELWRKLRIAIGILPRTSAHPQPLQVANRLEEHFAERSSSAQLPPEKRLHLLQVQMEREVIVRHEIEQTDTTDCLFTIEEIRRARKTSKETAPGSDGITYSLLSTAGLAGELALLTVTNTSYMHRQNRRKDGPYMTPLENWTTSPQYLGIHQRCQHCTQFGPSSGIDWSK